MALTPGTRVGPFEIITQIGAGGMGEVYHATDTNLKRAVAIKVLPASVAADPERLARFQREAEVLAALNHPNIAQIHGLERSDGITALVMELVDGPTLDAKITEGPLPVTESLTIAKQIADGLEAAHEQGIIHRDLKPANIKLRPDGTVKVLDFGLAKALEPAVASSVANLPTITSPAMTQAGMILGTAAYMSPEQARGRPVDRRADIWAFGCVLYEMLTGRRAFEDEDVSLTLSKVLRVEPAYELLPAMVPARVRRALELCLKKDVKQRAGDIHDVRLALEGAFETSGLATGEPVVAKSIGWRRVAAISVAALAIGAVLAGTVVWMRTRPLPARVTRFVIPTAGATMLSPGGSTRDIVLTPDGARIAYRAAGQIVVRALDELEPKALTGLGTPANVFPSADGHWLGFGESGQLRKVSISGGPSIAIAPIDGLLRGATWNRADTIVFATLAGSGLLRTTAGGGDVTVLTTPDRERGDFDHVWPEFLPDGEAVLFTITTAVNNDPSQSRIAWLDLKTGNQTVLPIRGSHARYVPTGHLIFGAGSTLYAVGFDLGRRTVVGTPVPVVSPVPITPQGAVQADLAADGTLVYLSGVQSGQPLRALVWTDRQGRETPIAGLQPRPYAYPRLSPDGTKVALFSADQENDLWIWDLARASMTRITDDLGLDLTPVWMPDGRLLFSSSRSGVQNLYVQPAYASGTATRLVESTNPQYPTGLIPNKAEVVVYEGPTKQERDILLVTLTPTPEMKPLVATRFDERGGTVSPDGRWLAYESNRSSQYEIYVQPFPVVNNGLVETVSTAGGVQPHWSPDGRELFYVTRDGSFMTVALQPRSSVWAAGTPKRLFEGGRYFYGGNAIFVGGNANLTRHYDVTADGQRFLMLKDERPSTNVSPEIIVVQHWFEELKRLVSTK